MTFCAATELPAMTSASKLWRFNNQLRRDAAKPIAQYMRHMGFYEMFRDEVPPELFDSWCVLWNMFDPEGLKNSIVFSYAKTEYMLTRY